MVSGSVGVQNQTAIVGQAGTIINMLGGQVAGVENHSSIGTGITTYGLFSSFGGLVMGGFTTGGGGATGLDLYGSASNWRGDDPGRSWRAKRRWGWTFLPQDPAPLKSSTERFRGNCGRERAQPQAWR